MRRVILWCVLPTLNAAVGQEADAAKDSLARVVPKCRFHTPVPLRGTPPTLRKELNSIAVQLFTKIEEVAEGRRGISFSESREETCFRFAERSRFEAKPHLAAKPQEGYNWAFRHGSMWVNKMVGSKVFRMTCVGVPLVVGGLVVKSEDDHFQRLRTDYLPSFDRRLDDYLQYLPAGVMVGMKAGGVEGRSSWGRMLVSDAFSAVITLVVVGGLKNATKVMRPDGSNNRSFPSGHTATAFMTATMLSKEYGGRSPWYGVGAYSVATATGLMRMANNKHWLSDVLAGAGFGILSTELGYYLADLIFKEKGITDLALAADFSTSCRPSFVGLYLGLNVVPGSYKLDDGGVLRFSSGSTAGIEGACFFTPYAGVGGRLGVSNVSVIWNGEAQGDTFDFVSLCAGGYFSYPFVPRLLIESKVLAGYVRSASLDVSGVSIAKKNMVVAATGISFLFRMNSRLGIRFSADYEMLPSFLKTSNRPAAHVFTLGGGVNVMF